MELINHNDVTIEHLKANSVKAAQQLEAKYLDEHEALVSKLQQKSSETVEILQPPLINVTDIAARNLEEERAIEKSSDVYVKY